MNDTFIDPAGTLREGNGRYAENRLGEVLYVGGVLVTGRTLSDSEQALGAAHNALAEERARFTISSSTLILDEHLAELAERGDRIASITAVPAEIWAGSPDWHVTEMITADGRNLVTGHRLDVNSAENRVIEILEGAGDGITGNPDWIELTPESDSFTVNLDKVRDGARGLGVDDGEPDNSDQRAAVRRGLLGRRELVASEYTLAAAAVVSEHITTEHPSAARMRFRYEDGEIRVISLTDQSGVPVHGDREPVNRELNRHIDFSDLSVQPLVEDGEPDSAWFNREHTLPFSWEWDLREVQGAADKYINA